MFMYTTYMKLVMWGMEEVPAKIFGYYGSTQKSYSYNHNRLFAKEELD
jgi:hypothetical protein